MKLDYISDLPRYVGKFHFQTTLDDKSGYDHVALSEDSYTFFGLEWQGWYFVFRTIPFGWKASAYLYHTIGLTATSYIRSLGVPCSQYIDDRHVGQLAVSNASLAVSPTWSDFELAEAAVFICAAVLVSLGYFLGLSKSTLIPSRIVKFLGFLVNSELCAFILPADKKEKFAVLREHVLSNRTVSIKTLQRLAGKISSFCIAVPAARLFAREIYRATAGFLKSSRLIKVAGDLKKEIEYWRFLDSWEGHLPWLPEYHVCLKVFSDASDFAWNGIISIPGRPPFKTRDYWKPEMLHLPIVVKEARALVNVLKAGRSFVCNTRVDVHVDSLAVLQSWQRQGGKNKLLNDTPKELHETALASNSHLFFQFVPSRSNPADAPSRQLSDKDCILSEESWQHVERHFGPHSIDLMSLDSNTQVDLQGRPLKHFSSSFSPQSSGVNMFAQSIACSENAYVIPPFTLIGPVLKFLLKSEVSFSIVVRQLSPLPFWWPVLFVHVQEHFTLGRKGESSVLLFLSSSGNFVTRPLQWDLLVFRVPKCV